MTRILVSGASGIVGYGILKSLRMGDKDQWLVGASNRNESAANVFSDQFVLAPETADADYLTWLLSTIDRLKIDIVIPGIDADLRFWLSKLDEIRSSGATPLLNEKTLIYLSLDKWEMSEHLRKIGESTRIPSSLSQDFDEITSLYGLPFIVKPRAGFGSKGFRQINNRAEFSDVRSRVGRELIAQPLRGTIESEFTIGAYGDGAGGFTSLIAMRRLLSPEGFTNFAEVVDSKPFEDVVYRLCNHFKAFGPTNFQFREHFGSLFLLEINPRISSSASIRARFGYNEAQMAVDHLTSGVLPEIPRIVGGRAIRYAEDIVFLDLETQTDDGETH